MNKINKILLYVDIFGYTPRIEIKHKLRYKTYFGSIISLLALLSIFIIIGYSSKELFEKSRPEVLLTVYKDQNPTKIEFTDKNFMMTLGVTFGDDTYIIDESIYKMRAVQITMIRPGDGQYYKTKKELEVVRCNEIEITILPDYFKREDLSNLFCMKNLNAYVQGEYGQEEYTWIEFSFSKCNKNFRNCQSDTIIEQKLKGAYVSLYMIDTGIIETKLKKPFQIFGKNFYNLMTLQNYKEFNLFFKNIQIITDHGWLWTQEKVENSFAFEKSIDLWDYRNTDQMFYSLNFRASNLREVYKRSYLKLFNIMSGIGGFIKLIMLIGEFIVHFYSELSFKDYITKFFNVNKKKQNNKNNAHAEVNQTIRYSTGEKNIGINNFFQHTESKLRDNSISNNTEIILRNDSLEKMLESRNDYNDINENTNESEPNIIKPLNFMEKFYEIICCSKCKPKAFQKKINNINQSMDKIKSKLDWVNIIRFQNEYEAFKSFFLTKEQNDVFNLNFHFSENFINVNFL